MTTNLKFPIFFSDHLYLIYSDKGEAFDWSERCAQNGTLVIGVRKDGRAHLDWIVDFDGRFYDLTSLGVNQHTLFSFLRLTRRTESFRIEDGRPITVAELMALVRKLKEFSHEAPVMRYFRETLRRYDPDRIVDNEIMREGMGMATDSAG